MGWTESPHEEGLMTASEIAAYLMETCKSLSDFEPYMFGSTLCGVGSDIDILVVGTVGEKLMCLKQEIAIAGLELPLDVLYMDPSEAHETGFVANERCVALSLLAAQGS